MIGERTSKFFRFTIYGDNLDVEQVKAAIDLPADVFNKNTTIIKVLGETKIPLAQRTNRWAYHNEAVDSSEYESFLEKNLFVLSKYKKIIKKFIKNNKAVIELIIYAGDKTDIRLSTKNLKILNDLGIEFCISFC